MPVDWDALPKAEESSSIDWDALPTPEDDLEEKNKKAIKDALFPSKLEAFGRSALSGVTIPGLPGVAAGGYEAIKGLPAALDSDSPLKALAEKYSKGRKDWNLRDAQALAAHPNESLAGGIVGGVINPLDKIFKVGKGGNAFANLLKRDIKSGLAQGAAAGALTSQGNDITDVAKDAAAMGAFGGLVGGAANLGLAGAQKAVAGLTPANAAKKFGSVIMNTPEELTELRLQNPEAFAKDTSGQYLNNETRGNLARAFGSDLDRLKDDVLQGSKASRDLLNKEGKTFVGRDIVAPLDEMREALIKKRAGGALTDRERNTAEWLEKKAAPFRREDQFPTETYKDLIQDIDQDIQWDRGAGAITPRAEAVQRQARGVLDERLKAQSPAYADLMKQVAADTGLLDKSSHLAKNEAALANIFRRLQTDQYGGGQIPRETLEAFDKRMGTNYLDRAKFAQAREAFDKSATQGSMNVNKFRGMAQVMPDFIKPIAEPIAAITGAAVDKYGRPVQGKLVDAALAISKAYKNAPNLQKAVADIKPFYEAAKAGSKEATLIFSLLEQSNPDLIEMLRREERGEEL